MANQTDGNPIIYDTATGAEWNGTKHVVLVQWVDDNADVATDDDLVFEVNGVTFTGKIQVHGTAASIDRPLVHYQIGPFATPMAWTDFALKILDNGAFVVWLDNNWSA